MAATPSGGEFRQADLPQAAPPGAASAAAIGIIVGRALRRTRDAGVSRRARTTAPGKAGQTGRGRTILIYNGAMTLSSPERDSRFRMARPLRDRLEFQLPARTSRAPSRWRKPSGPRRTSADVSCLGQPRRSGVWSDRSTPGRRSLFVVADCSWSVERPAREHRLPPRPSPGIGATHKPKHQHTD